MNAWSNKTRLAGSTNDQVIYAGRCVLYGIYPELTTTGTVEIHDHASTSDNLIHNCAIGLTQAGKTFGPKGIVMNAGLVIDLSVASDLCLVVWEPLGKPVA